MPDTGSSVTETPACWNGLSDHFRRAGVPVLEKPISFPDEGLLRWPSLEWRVTTEQETR
jgi:hypothetical protein